MQTFNSLKQAYNLPNSYLFRYPQLRHAFQTQFDKQPAALYTSGLENLLRNEFMTKPLSTIYKELLPSIHDGLESLKAKLLSDFPELEEDWKEMWECTFSQLVSTRGRLIQFKIQHQVYLTPMRLYRTYLSVFATCWRCLSDSADFIHIFWRCSLVQTFWTAVTSVILSVTTIQVPLMTDLDLVDSLAPRRDLRTLLGLLHFYARKAIVLKWKLNFWKHLVNSALSLYKATY